MLNPTSTNTPAHSTTASQPARGATALSPLGWVERHRWAAYTNSTTPDGQADRGGGQMLAEDGGGDHAPQPPDRQDQPHAGEGGEQDPQQPGAGPGDQPCPHQGMGPQRHQGSAGGHHQRDEQAIQALLHIVLGGEAEQG